MTKFERYGTGWLKHSQIRVVIFSGLFCYLFVGVSLSQGDDRVDKVHDEALEKYKAGDHVAAIDLLSELSDEDFKRHPEAERLLGVLLYQEGKVKEAGERVESAWRNGSVKALRYAAQAKIELNELEWLKQNRDELKKDVARDINSLDVFMLWYLRSPDLQILKDGFDSAKLEDILKEEAVMRNFLKTFRHMIEDPNQELFKAE